MSKQSRGKSLDVIDETEHEEDVPVVQYEITSFGADYVVEGLIARLRKDEIFVPAFQRSYVWRIKDASQFIESLLLGLPVPGIFLAREQESNRYMVIDGQQRLKSLQFFYDGVFNPKPDDKRTIPFRLTGVQRAFEGKTYEDLSEDYRIQLDNSIIHATIIKQDSPKDDDTSIYHVFERLNTGGIKLTAQEVRVAAFHGKFIALLSELNENSTWRSIFGKHNKRLKDQELILRFLALLFDRNDYERPFNEFLNKFCERHRNPPMSFLANCRRLFESSIELVHTGLGLKAFRPVGAINAAVFDAVMVAIATRLKKGTVKSPAGMKKVYSKLLDDPEFKAVTSQSTSDEANVKLRINKAISAFKKLK